MGQTASIRLTLTNVATEEDIHDMEERIMSALTDAIGELKATVEQLKLSQNPQRISELEAALAAERDLATKVAELEAAEDVAQNDELAAAKAERDEAVKATDSLMAEMNEAAAALGDVTEQLNAVGAAADEPVEVPAEEPADAEVSDPDGDEPAAEIPGEPGVVEPVVDEDNPDLPIGERPSPEALPETVESDGGPTDSSGRPIDGPLL